jgi:hypothetical protein
MMKFIYVYPQRKEILPSILIKRTQLFAQMQFPMQTHKKYGQFLNVKATLDIFILIDRNKVVTRTIMLVGEA